MRPFKLICYILAGLLLCSAVSAQYADSMWSQTYWNGWFDSLNCVQETSDRGFIMTGVSWAEGESQTDIKLVKADSLGIEDWSILIGDEAQYECGFHVLQTHDGGYLISARSDLTGSPGGGGIWIVRTDAVGDTLWTLPWCPDDRGGFPIYACHTAGGNYAITGVINLATGNTNEAFILVVDDDGVIVDAETYGAWSWQSGDFVEQLADSGFMVAGRYDYPYATGYDWWAMRTDKDLVPVWDSTYALSGYHDGLEAACLAPDGLVMVGGNRGVGHAMKVDFNGNTVWSKVVSVTPYDESYNTVCLAGDGGYMVGGYRGGAGMGWDFTFTKLDAELDAIWSYAVGGAQADVGQSIVRTYDGGFAQAGPTNSGVTGEAFWLVKIGSCCNGRVGDVNGSGDDEPTIGDVSVLIDAMFVSVDPSMLPCYPEADINQSGGSEPLWADITIGDLSMLIDYLFVSIGSFDLGECM